MKLIASDLTGYAEFEGGGDRLRIYTANKRPLEELFGVDLIYLNLKQRNMVLIQYKMLEPIIENGEKNWIYRPNRQLDKEIERMDKFRKAVVKKKDYRLNPEAFYMKFVKRDASTDSAGIIMPVDHFEVVKGKSRGPGGGVRISYNALNGQYLREPGLIALIRSGYIGAQSDVTSAFEKLVASIVKGGNAVVAAIQENMSS
jgi:hypothetical protein